MRVGFCYNILHEDTGGLSSQLDFDRQENVDKIAQIITGLGHEVIKIEANAEVFESLKKLKPEIDLVFNIAEGLYGDARESWVPLACEILQIPYTHSTPTVHALKLDKRLAKLAVKGLGVKVPEQYPCDFPVIIKPKAEGSSMGVFNDNVVNNEMELKKRIKELKAKGLMGELLIERYIEGREFTVGMLGNGEQTLVLPIIEQKFGFLPKGMQKIAGYELKWMVEDKLEDKSQAFDCPAKLNNEIRNMINDASRKIYDGLGVRDCARIDFRMDENNEIYFLEINTLPGMNFDPKVISYFPTAAKAAGLMPKDIVEKVIEEAVKRNKFVSRPILS